MSVSAKFKIDDPRNLPATLTLTMTVEEWRDLRDQLSQRHPASRVYTAIGTILAEVDRVFYATEERGESQ